MTATAFERPDRRGTRDNIHGREWAVTIRDGAHIVTRGFGDDEATARAVAAHINEETS